MADYWKSQPRKFCEFCKCWITDNKPSVEFHERGKRHKENVQKKIDELRKRSGEKAKEQEELDAGMAHIERAALEALKKDLTQDPSLAAQYGVKLKNSGSATEKETDAESSKAAPPAPKVKEWFEAKSPEGYSYYWNVSTNESVWEPPAEYVSLAEQEGKMEQSEESQKVESKTEEEYEKEEEEIEAPPPKKVIRVDPKFARGSAYGAWTTIREEPAPEPEEEPEPEPQPEPEPPVPGELPAVVDIPLPGDIPLPPASIPLPPLPSRAPASIPLPSEIPLPGDFKFKPKASESKRIPEPEPEPETEPSEPEICEPPPVKKDRFKEKTVASLGFSSGGNVAFKKRKVAASARNARQRDDDD